MPWVLRYAGSRRVACCFHAYSNRTCVRRADCNERAKRFSASMPACPIWRLGTLGNRVMLASMYAHASLCNSFIAYTASRAVEDRRTFSLTLSPCGKVLTAEKGDKVQGGKMSEERGKSSEERQVEQTPAGGDPSQTGEDNQNVCPECGGSGKIQEDVNCPNCGGTGKVVAVGY